MDPDGTGEFQLPRLRPAVGSDGAGKRRFLTPVRPNPPAAHGTGAAGRHRHQENYSTKKPLIRIERNWQACAEGSPNSYVPVCASLSERDLVPTGKRLMPSALSILAKSHYAPIYAQSAFSFDVFLRPLLIMNS